MTDGEAFPTAPGRDAPSLLCIDDDPDQHRAVVDLVAAFRRSPYAVAHASDYEEGLARLSSGRHQVCLLSDRLGARDGLELLSEARALNPSTPVIVITSSDVDEVDIAASEAGAVDLLVRSELTARVLERAVRRAVTLGETLTRLREQAIRDELTGLLNRREFQNLLHNEWLRSVRFKRPFAVGLADIDYFKGVNDGYGHLVGDRVIRHVAEVLDKTLRRLDRVARVGGEEFAILMPETGRREAAVAMDRLRAAMAQSPCEVPEARVRITVTLSIGVSVSLEDADSADGLVAVADRRLYAAKHAGRDCVHLEG